MSEMMFHSEPADRPLLATESTLPLAFDMNRSPDLAASPSPDVAELRQQLQSSPQKNQIPLLDELANLGEPGLQVVMDFLREHQSCFAADATNYQPLKPNLAVGKAYQVLYTSSFPHAANFLQAECPHGVVPLRSHTTIDYTPLQQLLAKQDFLTADQLTLQKLCELAGEAAIQRKWIYFTEVEQFPTTDLQTINDLWLMHSGGQFGFSVQRELWLSVGKNWEKLWDKIGWKAGNNWTRYPQEFTWDLTAPRGHLPLSNQLRGVRVIASLLAHPAWNT